MYIYIFGSTCRGELDQYSDIDLLAVHDFEENIDHLDANKISIYTENKLKKPFRIISYFCQLSDCQQKRLVKLKQ